MGNNLVFQKIINREKLALDEVSKDELAELVRNVATMDNLTGVNNEIGLYAFSHELMEKGTVGDYDTYFCNIRSMRLLNERWSFVGGNQILTGAAQFMAKEVAGNGVVARMGGDNFFVLLKKGHREAFIAQMADFVVEISLDNAVYFVRVGARMGMYDNKPGDTIRYCMDSSSMALQFIRSSSEKFFIMYEETMKQRDLRAKGIKDDLKKAIEDREFEIFYQPKVDLNTKEICGAEALSRWNRRGEVVSPSEFVPILEQTGAICHLDFYVFEQVCRDVKSWEEKGINPIRISSNFSKRHLGNADFADRIFSILDKYQVDYDLVEIELTEASDAEDSRALKGFLDVMRAKGVRTSIDDFGSGYSSLKLLKEMKMNSVKLDKSLIDDIGVGIRENDAIVANLISMLRDLGMEVIAEGAEYSEQIYFLKKSGCNIVQGYYFDKPLKFAEFEERLKKKRYI